MPKQFGDRGPRAIYPDAATSRNLGAASIEAQLLFDRLICQADDQGRIEGDSVIVKALCVPLIAELTPERVEAALRALARGLLINRYQAPGYPHLIQLSTWWRWQAGMRRAYPSRWPAAEGWEDAVYGFGGDGPKTYRDWADLPRSARKLPAELPAVRPQVAGNSPQISALTREPAQPLPVPSAGASAGASAEIPPPPAERGRRSNATNPRATKTNPRSTGDAPRQQGTSTRQVRESQKRGPVALGTILSRAFEQSAPAPRRANGHASAGQGSLFEEPTS